MSLLEVSGVVKTFGAVRALDGLDLVVNAGGVFGVVGPNGAGKTTLFSVICGFLGADKGSVRLLGQEVRPSQPPPAGRMAILPQDASFIAGVPIREQLKYYARLSGFSKADAGAESLRVLELVGLAEYAKKAPEQLSHGMRKRVGIAQAFVGEPNITILDEPTAGLDPHAAREIRALIRGIRGDRTVIVSSHNLLEIEDLCTEVAIVHKGRMVRQDKVSAVIGEAAEIGFRMAEPPAADVLARLEAIEWVVAVYWDNEVARLRVTFDPITHEANAASRDLVSFMVEHGVGFLDMQLGKSLEDRFVEETR